MVKKIKKYLKFMVCCALIMSLVAPSYAALSASDGSAFVTKAEFDSALADFNARLTTFEAGINSKIDSQVTSYLDRNGIWNGKEQFAKWDAGGDYMAFPKEFNGWITPNAVKSARTMVGVFDAGQTPPDWVICTKSGLAVFVLEQLNFGEIYVYGTDIWGHLATWSTWLWELCVVDGSTGANLSSFFPWGGTGSQTTRGYSYAANQCYNEVFLGFAPYSTSFLFFVRKDQKLMFKEVIGRGGNTPTQVDLAGGGGVKYRAVEFKIY